MKCHIAIKTLLIGLGLVSFSEYANCAQQIELFSKSGQYSMSVQSRHGDGAYMPQQFQGSQDVMMSVPMQGGYIGSAASQQSAYNSGAAQPQQYSMSAQSRHGDGACMPQQFQSSQGGTMSGLRPWNAPHGMSYFVPQQSNGPR